MISPASRAHLLADRVRRELGFAPEVFRMSAECYMLIFSVPKSDTREKAFFDIISASDCSDDRVMEEARCIVGRM